MNLEIIFLALCGLMIFPLILLFLEICVYPCDAPKRSVQKFKYKKFYWNTYIRFFLEFYLELSIVMIIRI